MKKQELVVKSNRLIEASYRLSLVEQQILLYAVCRCREEEKGLTADQPITIRATEFAAQFGSDISAGGVVYRQLKEAMDHLFNRWVLIHDTDPETSKPRVTKTHWISQASYVDGAGHVQLIFAPAVIPYITRLEKRELTRYKLEQIGRMTSLHAIRLYELLVQYLAAGGRSIEVPWLKQTLHVENEYPRILDLKKRVIDVAVKQINEYSDIQVSYTQRKFGRTITHLDFNIKSKAKGNQSDSTPKKSSKRPTVDRDYVERHARPGESYDQAFRRLLEEAGQQPLPLATQMD